MKGTGSKNAWALFLFMLTGIVLGGFIGMLAEGVPALSWLSYGQAFGLENPIVLNLGILVLTFGLSRSRSQVSSAWSLLSLFTVSYRSDTSVARIQR